MPHDYSLTFYRHSSHPFVTGQLELNSGEIIQIYSSPLSSEPNAINHAINYANQFAATNNIAENDIPNVVYIADLVFAE
jgi:hypothetical protein